MKFDVVCFGSAMVDAFMETYSKEEDGNIIIPQGSKQLIKNLSFQIGGGGTNTAVAFSRLGLRTGYIGKIGKDTNGSNVLDMLRHENITFLGKQVDGETSGFSVVLVGKERRRSILAFKGINDTISESEIKQFDTEWIYFSSMMHQSFQTQLKIARRYKRNGVKIAFNPSEYLIGKENLRPLIEMTDVMILNKEEAALLTKDKDKLSSIQRMGPKIVVITDGERTTYCKDGQKIYALTPKKIKPADGTGAGDAFSAGFVAGMIKEKPIEFCLRLGAMEASEVIKHIGPKNNLIRMKLK